MFIWQKGDKIIINDKGMPDETNPVTILDLEDMKSRLTLDGQDVCNQGAILGVSSLDGQKGDLKLSELGIKSLAKQDKIDNTDIDDETVAQVKITGLTAKFGSVDSEITSIKGSITSVNREITDIKSDVSDAKGNITKNETAIANNKADANKKFTALDEKLKNVKGIIRFKQSDVSSALAQSTTLLKSDLANEEDEPQVGNLAIFPDSKSLVLYIATITEVNGDSVTVSDPEYLRDTWVMSGEWVAGPASYPEVYTYQGSTYLCIVSDTNTTPSKAAESEWKVIAEKPATPTYKDLPDKPNIPRPTFFKITGDAMEDTGGAGTTYLVSNDNVSPAGWTMAKDDTVIFYTSLAYYIGKVTETGGSGATVTVEQRLCYKLPEITEGDEGKIIKVQDGKFVLVAAE